MTLTKVSYSMISGTPISIIDFGADPSGTNDSTAAIQSAITTAITEGRQVYIPSGTYKYTSNSTFDIDLTTAQNTLTIFGEDNSTIVIDANNVVFNVKSNPTYKFYCNNVNFEITNIVTNTNATVFYFSNGINWGSHFHFEKCNIQGFTNCAIQAIRAFNSGAKDCFFIGTSQVSGGNNWSADDAGVRLWGADGTLTLQDHSFCNLIVFENCFFSKVRYGIDGWGLYTSTFLGCTFEPAWIGVINRPAPMTAGGMLSSAYKSGYGVATTNLVSCWFEEIIKYDFTNVDIDPITGNNLNSNFGSTFYSTDYTSADYTKNRYIDETETSHIKIFRKQQGTSLLTEDPNYNFFYIFTNNPDIEYYKFTPANAYMYAQLYAESGLKTKYSSYNGGNQGTSTSLVLGTYQLWVDSSGRLRIKYGTPTSDTDGTIVGTQS